MRQLRPGEQTAVRLERAAVVAIDGVDYSQFIAGDGSMIQRLGAARIVGLHLDTFDATDLRVRLDDDGLFRSTSEQSMILPCSLELGDARRLEVLAAPDAGTPVLTVYLSTP